MAAGSEGGAAKKSGASKKTLQGAEIQTELLRRVPPHSVDAETGVLCGILTRPNLLNSIADILVPEDFYSPANQLVYNSFLQLYAKSAPIDLVSCAEYLKEHQQLEEAGGAVYLAQLGQAVVMGANAEYYAGIVRARSMRRKLIDICAKVISNCYDSDDEIETLLDESERAVFSVARQSAKNDFIGSRELLDKVFENLSRLASSNNVINGVTTGFTILDNLTGGLQKSDLIIVAGRPSMGKTAFAVCLAMNAAIKQNVTTAIFSLEMSKEQLMQRMLAARGKVNLSSLRKHNGLKSEDWQHLYSAADIISKAPIFIDDSSAISPMELRAKARRLKSDNNLGLIVVDYLQLMRSSRKTDSRELEISDISRSLKALAKELDIPVVALSQLNRKVEDRPDKRPILADLRESGAIEQDADVIMFVYREDVYKIKNPAERPPEGEAEIIIGKQRNGPVGVAPLIYKSSYTSFENRAFENYEAPSGQS